MTRTRMQVGGVSQSTTRSYSGDFSAKMSVAEPGIQDDWIGFLYMLVKILLK